jgi:glutamate racemase
MIGVFDSGFGGLTVLRELVKALPSHDFLYLGDNARAPYGGRSFETIRRYTLEAVEYLFAQGCPLVILACNTASARALRTIQMEDLPKLNPQNRVLGVLRPVVEIVGEGTESGHVGILGTQGTVRSLSYPIEIARFWPNLKVEQQACPMWVPLVENGELGSEGARYFVRKDLQALLSRDPLIDQLVLGCTHYPLLLDLIRSELPAGVNLLNQAAVVAEKTREYLEKHPEMEDRLSKSGRVSFLTTDTIEHFEQGATAFFGQKVQASWVRLDSFSR